MEENKLFPGKPLIQNAVHPDDLFTETEIDLIKNSLERKIAEKQGKKTKALPSRERATTAYLLDQARFQGYFPDKIDINGSLKWACIIYHPIKGKPCVIISIMPCLKCSVNFHSSHYEDMEPSVICNNCHNLKKNKITPPELKNIPHVKKMTNERREKRISYLREQSRNISDD